MTHRLLPLAILTGLLSLSVPCAASDPPATAPPFALNVWPQRVSVFHRHPIYLRVALENMTDQDRSIRFRFAPTPFGPPTDLHSLMMRCFRRNTNKEVRYIWPPPGETADDAQGRESAEVVSADSFTGYTVNLADYCDLPPGDYVVVMQYDTSYVPPCIRRNKRAWHGRTNKVTASIHISPAPNSRRKTTAAR